MAQLDLLELQNQETYTSTTNYCSAAFSSGTDVTESLTDLPDLFGFDVTITGIVISRFDGNINTRPLDTTNPAKRNGWRINGGTGDRQLLVDDDEGLLITFDSLVEISEIEFSGVGIKESQDSGAKIAGDRVDDGINLNRVIAIPESASKATQP